MMYSRRRLDWVSSCDSLWLTQFFLLFYLPSTIENTFSHCLRRTHFRFILLSHRRSSHSNRPLWLNPSILWADPCFLIFNILMIREQSIRICWRYISKRAFCKLLSECIKSSEKPFILLPVVLRCQSHQVIPCSKLMIIHLRLGSNYHWILLKFSILIDPINSLVIVTIS